MTYLKATWAAAGLLAIATLAAAPASAQTRPTKITIATEGAYEPWNFQTPDGKLDGMELEFARDLCARMKVECAFVAQDWDGLIPALTAGKYDVIMAAMFITPKRLETIDFTMAYAMDPSGFAVPKNSPLAGLGDPAMKIDLKDPAAAKPVVDKMLPLLKGKLIGVQAATTNVDFLKKYFPTLETREYKTTEQHDLDLAAGRVDALFAQQTALAATLAKPDFKDYQLAGPGFLNDVFGMGTGAGVRKSDTVLKGMLNEAIAAAIADGTVKKLSMKWFKTDVTPVK